MSVIAAGLIAGGVAIGAVGGMMQAKAQKAQINAQIQSAKDNRAYDEKNALVDQGRALRAAYGNRAAQMASSVLSEQEIAGLFGYSPQYYAMQEANFRGLSQQVATQSATLAGLKLQQKNAVIDDPQIKQLTANIKAAQASLKDKNLTAEQKTAIQNQIKGFEANVKERTAVVRQYANTELAQRIAIADAAVKRSATDLAATKKAMNAKSPDPYFNQAKQTYMPNPRQQPYPSIGNTPPFSPPISGPIAPGTPGQTPIPDSSMLVQGGGGQYGPTSAMAQLGPAQQQLMARSGGGGPAFLQQAQMLSSSPQAQMAQYGGQQLMAQGGPQLMAQGGQDPQMARQAVMQQLGLGGDLNIPSSITQIAQQFGMTPSAVEQFKRFAAQNGLDPENITQQQILDVFSRSGIDPIQVIAGQAGITLPQAPNAYADALNAISANQPLPGQPGYQGYDPNEGYISTMSRLLNQYDLENQALYDLYGNETAQLRGEAAANLAALSGFGQERMGIIDRDAARAQRESQASIAAQMARSGLGGSTLTAQALSQNAKQLMEGAADKKASIQDQIMQMEADQRQNNLNLLAGRLAGGTEMRGQILRESQSLRQQPLMQEINMLTGGTFSPFAGKDTSAYFPGVTSAGIGSGIMGGLVGSLGGQLGGMGMQKLSNQLGLGR